MAVGVVYAANVDVRPDGTIELAGSNCNISTAHGNLDEDVDGTPDGNECAATSNSSINSIHLQFATPAADPVTTTDAQVFAFRAKRNATGGNGSPTVTASFYCNNGSVIAVGSAQVLTNTYDIYTQAFTFDTGSCAADGSDVEVLLECTPNGGGPNQRSCSYESVEWRAEIIDLTTTLGSGTDPSSTTVAPESGIRDAGSFTLETNQGEDSVTALTVILAGSGTPYDGLSEVSITSDDGNTTYFSAISNPSDNSLDFSGETPIPVSTTPTQFKIRVTPKTHANMAAPPGALYALSPRVSAFTSTDVQAGSDSNANTLTVDNESPGNVTGAAANEGNDSVEVEWTNPGASDFSNVLVLRHTTTISDTPTEGSSPSLDASVGSSVVRYNGSGTSFTDSGLDNGTEYFYRIFAKDSRGNYSQTGVEVSATPALPDVPTVTTGSASGTTSATLSGNITATGDGDNISVRGFAWGTSPTLTTVFATTTDTVGQPFGIGAFTQHVSGLISGTTYYFRAYATNPGGTGFGTIESFVAGVDNTPSRKLRVFEGFTLKLQEGGTLILHQQ